jgi:hypothetical protein
MAAVSSQSIAAKSQAMLAMFLCQITLETADA